MSESETKPPTLTLAGGRYAGVKVGAAVPDVVLVGPQRVRYEVVRDPDTGERLGLVYAPEPLDEAVFDLQDTRPDRPSRWRWPWLRRR